MRDITVGQESSRPVMDPIPAGTQLAKLYCIADIGTHFDDMYGKSKHEVVFIWELPEERIKIKQEDGTEKDMPRAISKIYTLSLYENSRLYKDLVNWRGRDFNDEERKKFSLANVLSKSCFLSIIHKVKGDRTYANIGGISGLPKGMKHEPTENTPVMWGIGDDPELVPKWIVEKAKQSDEWKAKENPPNIEPPADTHETTTDDNSSDVPF